MSITRSEIVNKFRLHDNWMSYELLFVVFEDYIWDTPSPTNKYHEDNWHTIFQFVLSLRSKTYPSLYRLTLQDVGSTEITPPPTWRQKLCVHGDHTAIKELSNSIVTSALRSRGGCSSWAHLVRYFIGSAFERITEPSCVCAYVLALYVNNVALTVS